MPFDTVSVFWQSHPYGWRLRWFAENGRYAAELISSAPPYRQLCSGSLNLDDAAKAWHLVEEILASAAIEPADPHAMAHIGYVVPVAPPDDIQKPVPYYYYPQQDKRKSTRHFVNLVHIIDGYLRSRHSELVNRDDLWEQQNG